MIIIIKKINMVTILFNGGDLVDKRVAVESSLTDHIAFLESSGYEVERLNNPMDSNNNESFNLDAIVVSSLDNAQMENPSYRPSAPVVEAKGKSPEEVFNILRGRY